MKTLAFVTPWFGEKIPGGAEMELRGLTSHLHEAGVSLEILTTCVKEFSSDWNCNYYPEGETKVLGMTVKRFNVRKRNVKKFDAVNYKLMNHLPISIEEESIYCREMVNSPKLYRYMEENQQKYSLFIFIPYMFGTTYYGCQICPEKSVLIPCFHDESYVYMECFKKVFSRVAGMIFHASAEYELAKKIYNLETVKCAVLGEGVETDIFSDGNAFRDKFQVKDPFIIYAGRKDKGKNVDVLMQYFTEYKRRNKNELKLVLIGGGEMTIPPEVKQEVFDLGFVELQEKYDACAAAELLCQPSNNESFSLVIMESWLCKSPVLVSGQCAVTKGFVKEIQGGLYFNDYFEFEGAVNYLLKHPEVGRSMGENGRNYVMKEFSWEVIIKKYLDYFGEIIQN